MYMHTYICTYVEKLKLMDEGCEELSSQHLPDSRESRLQ